MIDGIRKRNIWEWRERARWRAMFHMSVGRAAGRDTFKFAIAQLVGLLTFFHPLFTGIIFTKTNSRSCLFNSPIMVKPSGGRGSLAPVVAFPALTHRWHPLSGLRLSRQTLTSPAAISSRCAFKVCMSRSGCFLCTCSSNRLQRQLNWHAYLEG